MKNPSLLSFSVLGLKNLIGDQYIFDTVNDFGSNIDSSNADMRQLFDFAAAIGFELILHLYGECIVLLGHAPARIIRDLRLELFLERYIAFTIVKHNVITIMDS